jgi:type IV pilus assembly protein PilA
MKDATLNSKLIGNRTITQQGFSLIELMVVVAIVGILTLLAVPAYQDYLIKAKATEMLSMSQGAKIAVSEALMNGQTLATLSNQTLGLSDIQSPIVENIHVAAGVITITANHANIGLPAVANGQQPFTMVLTPTQAPNTNIITWRCTIPEAQFSKYVPPGCH